MQEKFKELLTKADAWIAEHKEEFISEIQGLAFNVLQDVDDFFRTMGNQTAHEDT